MKSNYRIKGLLILVASVGVLIVGVILRKNGFDFFGALVSPIVSAGTVLSVMWLGASRNEKTSKHFNAEQKGGRFLTYGVALLGLSAFTIAQAVLEKIM